MIDLSTITIGQYAHRDSWIHALDPRTKLIITMGLLLFILTFHSMVTLIGCFLAIMIVYQIAQLSPVLALRNIRSFLWLFLFTILIHAFSSEGNSIITIPFINWYMTWEGISAGIFYTIRIILLIVIANLLTFTTSPMAFTDGLEILLKPLKYFRISSHEIAMMISIALRFIPILLEEVDRIQKAQISRGARFDGNMIRRIKSVIPIVIPLFVSTFRRANDLALAMDARCYRGGENRTSYQILRLNKNDWLLLASCGMILIPLSIWG